MLTDYEQQLEAAFDGAAASNAPAFWSNGKPLVIRSGKALREWLDSDADEYIGKEIAELAAYETGPTHIDVKLNWDKRYEAMVAAKDWKAVNAMNDQRAKVLIKQWENDLPQADAQTETAPAPERFHIYSHDELLARAPPQWIVPGVLPEAELCEIFGESGSGKSFYVYDLAAAIHQGAEWCGIQCKQGRCLIVAAEGARGFRNRAEAYAKEYGASDLPPFIVDAPNLLDANDAPAFVTKCAAAGPWTAIILDTRSAVTPGGNENSGEDGGKLIDYCKLLHRKTGALVILIHHVGVGDKDRGRGWTGVKAACDTQILITRDNDMRSWKLAKQKDSADGPEGPHGHFKLRPVKLANGDTSCVVEHCEKPTGQFESKDSEPSGTYQKHIAEFLRGKGPQSMEDLRAYVRGQVPRGEGTKDRRGDCTSKAFNALRQKHLVNVTEGSNGDRVQWHVQPSSGNDPFGD